MYGRRRIQIEEIAERVLHLSYFNLFSTGRLYFLLHWDYFHKQEKQSECFVEYKSSEVKEKNTFLSFLNINI